MRQKFIAKIASTVLVSSILCLSTSGVSFAKVRYVASIVDQPVEAVYTVVDQLKALCSTTPVEQAVYSAELVSIAAPNHVANNQLFDVSIKYRNTGNQPWFGSNSVCQGQSKTFLGTTRQKDRASSIHAPAIFGETQWFDANRIFMKESRVNPGEIAEFQFIGHAPELAGIYREYFAPVTEGKAWMDQHEVTFDLRAGDPVEDQSVLQFTREVEQSINLLDPVFHGDKKIKVDLSDQKAFVYVGDQLIRSFSVSSGKAATPTPTGNYKIQFKQEVRVAGAAPHYIMPKFMQFRAGGYGFHALPSLANDRGVFWREALNHIGSPRSHGCIRMLPADANFTFNFADVGTEVQIVW